MSVLTAVVVLQTVVTLALLVITVGLARRLRAHSDLFSSLLDNKDKLLPLGAKVPSFSATATDGSTVEDRAFRGPAAIALMAVDCAHCRTNLPEFVAYVRGGGYRRDQVLAVVSVGAGADESAASDMIEALTSAATVVRQAEPGGVLTQAFAVRAYPSFYLVDSGGVLSAAEHAVRRLPDRAPHHVVDNAVGR